MTARALILIAAGGSAALLGAALVAQYLFGLAPCALCITQRWPHLAAVVIGGVALGLPWVVWPVIGALAALGTAGVGAYHAGVELGWWPGPAACSAGPGISGVSISDLLDPTVAMAAPVACSEVAWSFAGISMAGWNAILSAALAVVWVMAARAMLREGAAWGMRGRETAGGPR